MKAFQKTDPPSPNLLILYTLTLPKIRVQLRQRYTENMIVGRKHDSGWPDTMRGCSQQAQLNAPRWQLFGSEATTVCVCVLDARRQRHTLRLSSCVLLWQPLNCLVHLQQWLRCQSVIVPACCHLKLYTARASLFNLRRLKFGRETIHNPFIYQPWHPPQLKSKKALESEERNSCFWAKSLHSTHPCDILQPWQGFAYCVCLA